MVCINKAVIFLWQKSGLNRSLLIAMVKGGLPPAIALSLFELDRFAANFTTVGYLVAIMSILSSAMLPRAKFLQTMMFNIIAICIGGCISLLTCYCSVSARKNTTSGSISSGGAPAPGITTSVTYSSSANAVSAIWLFLNIAIANAFRFKRPQLQVPVIIYNIFAIVSGSTAPLLPTMSVSMTFVKKLLEAFLSGFAIATVVNIFIFPVSSRLVVFTQFVRYIGALQGVINAQRRFLQSMESKDMMYHQDDDKGKGASKTGQAAKAVNRALASLTALHGKLHGDITFAKREFAYGKLSADNIGEIFDLFRKIFVPLLRLGSVVEIFERVAHSRGCCDVNDFIDEDSENPDIMDRKEILEAEQAEWNEIMKSLHAQFEAMSNAMNDGLLHASYALELTKKPKDKNVQQDAEMEETIVDLETRGKIRKPGDTKFGEYLEVKVRYFKERRNASLKKWCELKGVALPDAEDGSSLERVRSRVQRSKDLTGKDQTRQQLYLVLYLEFLLWSTGHAVLDLVKYADGKVESGQMKCKKIQVPGKTRLWKWLRSCLSVEDTTAEHLPEQSESSSLGIALGQSFVKRKDPEHLPPTNSWQRFGDDLRHFSHFFASPELIFGFRVACATMCIAIVAFLENTQRFFVEQRLVWAVIMVAIGMTVTTGSGAFRLLARVVGALVATVCSFAIWYIPGGDGNTAAVIGLVFVFTFCQTYILVAFRKFAIGVIIMMFTQVLIIGYELEVRKIGVAVATSNGQLYYPIYLLAPYRLATVAGGCLVAWIWSYIPYPITDKSLLRRQLGESIYLLANFYSIVHVTIKSRLEGTGGDPQDNNSPEKRLEKARTKILVKQMKILAQLRRHSAFTKFEPTLGGKFPKAIYDSIIQEVQNIMSYMSLLSYATTTFSTNHQTVEEHEWVQDFSRVMSSVNITSNRITTLLTLISSSVISGTPLPPYLQAPPPLEQIDKLRALDPEILNAKHIIEPGYAAFAVSQIASKLISDDLERLLKNVKLLLGEVEFSVHIISTGSSPSKSLGKVSKTD
ncbi:uncharacterized protein V1513DRAFT_440036 [Lipomyces chichibuensis]|uniref:uncharacterized protein n=1 Tax=Lipomyces chichibuensis TaxID=1546026 RepID=UPI003342FC47